MMLFVAVGCSSPDAPALPDAVPTATPAGESGPAPTAILITPTFAPPVPDSMSTQELHQRLNPLLDSTEGCTLPCYNGLVAGQSTDEDTLTFYGHLGIGLPDLVPGDYDALQDGDGTGRLSAWLTKSTDVVQAEEMGLAPPYVNVHLENNVVKFLYVAWEYYPPYLTIGNVLDRFGQPDQLNLALNFEKDPANFMLQLIYTGQQAGFAFYGETTGDASARTICLAEGQVLTLFSTFATDITPMGGLSDFQYLLPMQETLGLSYADFDGKMHAGECLTIPSDQWQPWLSLQTPE